MTKNTPQAQPIAISQVYVGATVALAATGEAHTVEAVEAGWIKLLDVDRKVRAKDLQTYVHPTPKAEAKAAEKAARAEARAAAKTARDEAKAAAKATRQPRERKPGSPVLEFDLNHYQVGLAKTPSGRKSIDSGDMVAAKFRGLALEDAYQLAADEMFRWAVKESDIPTIDGLKARYGHLNAGMQRMNLGNLVRGAMSRYDSHRAADAALRAKAAETI